MTTNPAQGITIPASLLPRDGRFGCGPSKVRQESVSALSAMSSSYLGTSHRQDTVKNVVGSLRAGLRELFSLPDDYEVLLGNGGATLFWDLATFSLIERQSQHLAFGEFSSKFASVSDAAPHLDSAEVIESTPGTHPYAKASDGIDFYALTHNETSTGVAMDIERPEGIGEALVAVDATSGAGGLHVDSSAFDVYYFSPQKSFGSDGGLWIALCSPRALDRVKKIAATNRWIPATLDLAIAIDNSKKNQTYNTPALATIYLMLQQVEWMQANGGLPFACGRSAESARTLYGWAESSTYATPFVGKPDDRSNVVGTIDIEESIDAPTVSKVLRANGIVDTESYRKLGRNQLRIGMFPAVDPDDVEALTACIDHVVTVLAK